MIPQAESEAGLVAYEQVLAFASLRRRRMPVIYVLFDILLAVLGGAMLGYSRLLGAVCFSSAILFAFLSLWNWKRLRALDAKNRALLADLHAKYGEDLPWLEVERQQAAIEQIRSEMADGTLPPAG